MLINLKLDIPKEYNDISKGEIAKLSMELKKIVDELNIYLNCLDEDNFSDKYNGKNNDIAESILGMREKIDSIERKLNESSYKKLSVTLTGNRYGATILNAEIKAGDTVLIVPQYGTSWYQSYGAYVKEVTNGRVVIAFSSPPSSNITINNSCTLIIF